MLICIAGKNDIATQCADWLLSEGLAKSENLLTCFNQTDNGEDSFQLSFKKYSRQNKLTEKKLSELFKLDDLVFFSLEFDKIIKPANFASNKLYNIHFSLLPHYRGMYTSTWPLLNGEQSSGVTLHKIDEGIDTGDIIDQIEFSIDEDDNCRDLYFKYTEQAIALFKNNFTHIVDEDFIAKKQNISKGSYYSKSSLDYANISINLDKTANEIRNQIRAYNFKEYQMPEVHGYKIQFASILKTDSTEKSGVILNNTDTYIDISTVDYNLRLNKAPNQ